MKQLSFKFVSLFVLVGAVACSELSNTSKGFENYTGPQVISHDVFMRMSDSGKLKSNMEAKIQLILQDEDQEFPEGVHIIVFDNKEQKQTEINAEYAYYDNQSKKWDLVCYNLVNFVNDSVVKSDARSERAFYYEDSSFWDLKGDVILNDHSTEQKIETQALTWQRESGDVRVPKGTQVQLTENRTKITGYQLEGNTYDSINYRLYNVVGIAPL